jgi:hypothetical protein
LHCGISHREILPDSCIAAFPIGKSSPTVTGKVSDIGSFQRGKPGKVSDIGSFQLSRVGKVSDIGRFQLSRVGKVSDIGIELIGKNISREIRVFQCPSPLLTAKDAKTREN